MKNLTKEQKLAIVSSAIDQGFDIQLNLHGTTFENGMRFLDKNYFPVEKTGIYSCEENKHAWIRQNTDYKENGDLVVVVFFDSVEGR